MRGSVTPERNRLERIAEIDLSILNRSCMNAIAHGGRTERGANPANPWAGIQARRSRSLRRRFAAIRMGSPRAALILARVASYDATRPVAERQSVPPHVRATRSSLLLSKMKTSFATGPPRCPTSCFIRTRSLQLLTLDGSPCEGLGFFSTASRGSEGLLWPRGDRPRCRRWRVRDREAVRSAFSSSRDRSRGDERFHAAPE